MATTEEQISIVQDGAATCLERVAALSQASPPPGPNAANGWFRESMCNDGALTATLQRPDIDDSQALLIWNDFTTFMADVRNGFHPENHYSGWLGNIGLFVAALQRYAGAVASLVGDLFAVLGGGKDNDRQAAAARIGTDINNLINATNAKGPVLNGTHANGWIQNGVRDAGARGVGAFDDALTKVAAPSATKVATILRELAVKLRDTADRNMNPWLDAQWQVEFQAKAQAAAAALRAA